jgi:hypothetical protein
MGDAARPEHHSTGAGVELVVTYLKYVLTF